MQASPTGAETASTGRQAVAGWGLHLGCGLSDIGHAVNERWQARHLQQHPVHCLPAGCLLQRPSWGCPPEAMERKQGTGLFQSCQHTQQLVRGSTDCMSA